MNRTLVLLFALFLLILAFAATTVDAQWGRRWGGGGRRWGGGGRRWGGRRRGWGR